MVQLCGILNMKPQRVWRFKNVGKCHANIKIKKAEVPILSDRKNRLRDRIIIFILKLFHMYIKKCKIKNLYMLYTLILQMLIFYHIP